MHENSELNKQLQQRGPVTQESSRHNLAFSSFAPHDWMCFQLCSSCTNGESDKSPPHVYEAISDEGLVSLLLLCVTGVLQGILEDGSFRQASRS